jgi:hypothetical protein
MPEREDKRLITRLDPEFRAHVDALIYAGRKCTDIYNEYPQLQAVMSLRTFQDYAKDLQDAERYEIFLANKRMLDRLLIDFGGDQADRTDGEKIAYAAALRGMLDDKPLDGIDAFAKVRRDWRKQDEHKLRMRLQEHAVKQIEGAARNEAGTGKSVVDLDEVKRIIATALFEQDMAA